MKKYLSIFVLLVLLPLIGCITGSDSKSDSDSIVGTWKQTTQTNYWGSISNPDSTEVSNISAAGIDSKLILNSDKTYKMQLAFITLEGTWSTSGDQLSLTNTFLGMPATNNFTYQLNGNQLKTTEQNTSKTHGETYDWTVNIYNRQ